MTAADLKEWHLDRKVSLGIIAGLAVQLVAGGMFIQALRSELSAAQREIAALSQRITDLDRTKDETALRLARIEERTENMMRIMTRIEDRISRGGAVPVRPSSAQVP